MNVRLPKHFNTLIKRIARKDEKALEEVYRIYGKLIFVTSLTISKSYPLADEVVDDVLFKIWKNAAKLDKINNPEGWLYEITANCTKDKIKAEKQRLEIFDMEPDNYPVEMQSDDFYMKISILNETEQEIMIMKFVEDLTFERIAKAMNKPLSSVTSVYYRALEKLKK